MVLGKELRVLQLDPQAAEGVCVPHWSSLSMGDLKAHLHSDAFPPTWPHLLIVPLPIGPAFKDMSLWGPFLFKPPHPPPSRSCLWPEYFTTAKKTN